LLSIVSILVSFTAATKNQMYALSWLILGFAFALWEGGRPWAVLEDGHAALLIVCLRGVLVATTTLSLGVAIGVTGRLLKMQPRACFSLASQLAITFAVFGCFVDFAYLGHFVSVWLPMVAFAPRIARKIVAPETGFW
jgi:hypothetical protein